MYFKSPPLLPIALSALICPWKIRNELNENRNVKLLIREYWLWCAHLWPWIYHDYIWQGKDLYNVLSTSRYQTVYCLGIVQILAYIISCLCPDNVKGANILARLFMYLVPHQQNLAQIWPGNMNVSTLYVEKCEVNRNTTSGHHTFRSTPRLPFTMIACLRLVSMYIRWGGSGILNIIVLLDLYLAWLKI